MDTQDTNQPLDEGKLEEEKKAAEVTDETATSAGDVSTIVVEKPQEEVESVTAEIEQTAPVNEEETAVEVAQPVEDVEESASNISLVEEEKEEEDDSEKGAVSVEENAELTVVKKYQHFNDNDEVIARLKEISESNCSVGKQEIDALKQTFYKIHEQYFQ